MEILKDNWFQNIVGGLITSALVLLLSWLYKRYRLRPLKRILGKDSWDDGTYNIVYPQFELDLVQFSNLVISNNQTGTTSATANADTSGTALPINQRVNNILPNFPFIFKHWSSKLNNTRISINNSVSSCEVRSINYLSSGLFSNLNCQSHIKSDCELHNKNDFSMVSVGGSVTEVFDEIMIFVKKYFELAPNSFKNIRKNKIYSIDNNFDFGLIVKTVPNNSDERVWISCFGLGEWGTSGSAWYLANKYKELHDEAYAWSYDICSYNNNKFIAVIKVPIGNDEKAELVDFYSKKVSLKEKVIQIIKKI